MTKLWNYWATCKSPDLQYKGMSPLWANAEDVLLPQPLHGIDGAHTESRRQCWRDGYSDHIHCSEESARHWDVLQKEVENSVCEANESYRNRNIRTINKLQVQETFWSSISDTFLCSSRIHNFIHKIHWDNKRRQNLVIHVQSHVSSLAYWSLTNDRKNHYELDRIDIKLQIEWFRKENGPHNASFGCWES